FSSALLFGANEIQNAQKILPLNSGETVIQAGSQVDSKDKQKKVFALTTNRIFYGAQKRGNFDKKWEFDKKASWSYFTNDAGLTDIDYDGVAELYFGILETRTNDKILMVYNPVANTIYQAAVKKDGSTVFGSNIKKGSAIYNWMEQKVKTIGTTTATVVEEKEDSEEAMINNSETVFLCDAWTNGLGDNSTKRKGGNFCGIAVDQLQDAELIFQKASGTVNYIAIFERFANGKWNKIYQGPMKNMLASSLIKNKKATHLNIVVNGQEELYDGVKGKIRVYKKTVAKVRTLPTESEAKEIAEKYAGLKRGESIFKVFSYEEKGVYKIAVITNLFAYSLEEFGELYKVAFKSQPLKKVTMLDQYNGVEDSDSDQVKDLFYTTVDQKTQSKILNLISLSRKSIYSGLVNPTVAGFENEATFTFTPNTPKNIQTWMENKFYQFGFAVKQAEISTTDPAVAIDLWFKTNRNIKLEEKEKQLSIQKYNGNIDFMSYKRGYHGLVKTLKVGSVEYRSYYRGVFAAYDTRTNESYIIAASKNLVNFGTELFATGDYVFVGMQNIGILRFNHRLNTITHIMPKELKGEDIWDIKKQGNNYLVKTDTKTVTLPASIFEK
ncbi:hypothetical protein JXR93_07720, partial [bacterium]|nr:hypothetical protein [bacterium]